MQAPRYWLPNVLGRSPIKYSWNVFSQAVEGVSIIRMTRNSLSFANEHGSERLQERSRLRQDTSIIFLRRIDRGGTVLHEAFGLRKAPFWQEYGPFNKHRAPARGVRWVVESMTESRPVRKRAPLKGGPVVVGTSLTIEPWFDT